MKRLLLAGTAFLALVALGSGTRAVPFDFTYTGSLVTFTVPTTDSYQILAFGAQGGDATLGSAIGVGGLGAEIGGNFSLIAGEILRPSVGGQRARTSKRAACAAGPAVHLSRRQLPTCAVFSCQNRSSREIVVSRTRASWIRRYDTPLRLERLLAHAAARWGSGVGIFGCCSGVGCGVVCWRRCA
jgi:hypothetical protein